MTKSSDLFTNQKEVDRAIQAAADQYELFNRSITQRKSRTPRTSKKASLTCQEAGDEWRVAHATYRENKNQGMVYKKRGVVCRVLL